MNNANLQDNNANLQDNNANLQDNNANLQDNNTKPEETPDEIKLSKIYKAISIILLIAGLIGGVVSGEVFKVTKITYQSSISDFNITKDVFNTALMVYIWIGSILIYAIFRGISIIMHNQETIIEKMDGKENTVEAMKDQSEDEKRTD